MNEIEKIKKEIKALQEKLKVLEDAARWEPKGGNHFLDCAYGFDTCETRDKAKEVFNRYYRLYMLAEELNEGWEPDWDDDTQSKWRVGYYHGSKSHVVHNVWSTQMISDINFKDEATAQRALKIIEAGGLEG